MTDQDGRRTNRDKSFKRRFIGAIAAGLSMERATEYAEKEPIGENAPPKRIVLNERCVEDLGIEYEGKQYQFVVENGELGVERVEND